jgi:hypothetical protein
MRFVGLYQAGMYGVFCFLLVGMLNFAMAEGLSVMTDNLKKQQKNKKCPSGYQNYEMKMCKPKDQEVSMKVTLEKEELLKAMENADGAITINGEKLNIAPNMFHSDDNGTDYAIIGEYTIYLK